VSGTTNYVVKFSSASTVATGSIFDNGNIGIGTTSPTAKLHVEGLSFFNNTISSSNKLVVESTQPGIILRETDQSGTTHRWIDVESGIFRILQTNNDYSSFVTQFVINSSGNVGIGTSSPGSKLDVQNTANSSTYVRIWNQNSGSSAYTGLDLQSYGGGWQVKVPASTLFANPLIFSFNESEKARITYDGNVGIGTSSPAYKLDVSGTGRVGDSFFITTATTADARLEIGSGRSGNGNSYLDLIGDATYTDYGLRLIRYDTGANANSRLEHKGTGQLQLFTAEAGSLTISTV